MEEDLREAGTWKRRVFGILSMCLFVIYQGQNMDEPAIPFLGVDLREMKTLTQKDMCTPRPLQHCSQLPRHGNLSVHQWVNRWRKRSAYLGLPDGLVVKNPPASSGDARNALSVPESGRSPGEGNGHPDQYSFLEDHMDRGAWQELQSWTRLSDTYICKRGRQTLNIHIHIYINWVTIS